MLHRSICCVVCSFAILLTGAGCHIFQGGSLSGAQRSTGPTPEQQRKLDEAEAATQAGDYNTALTLFEEILRENPTITGAYIGIGDVHMARDDFRQAEGAYRRAARLEPRNFDAQFGHGRALELLDRLSEAVQAYLRALSIRPDDYDANLNLARTYLKQEKPRLARPFAEKAVTVRSDSGDARITLGAVYEDLELYPEAIEQYRTAMELVEPSPELILSLVNTLSAADRHREAIDAAETLNRMEENANAYERMGRSYFKLRQYDQSVNAYSRAVEINPDLWVAWNGIGVNALNRWLLSKKRDEAAAREARNVLRESLLINPSQPRVIQLLSTYQL